MYHDALPGRWVCVTAEAHQELERQVWYRFGEGFVHLVLINPYTGFIGEAVSTYLIAGLQIIVKLIICR